MCVEVNIPILVLLWLTELFKSSLKSPTGLDASRQFLVYDSYWSFRSVMFARVNRDTSGGAFHLIALVAGER